MSPEVKDLDHHTQRGRVLSVDIGKPSVSYKTISTDYEDVGITEFGMVQLLKLCGLSKTEAKNLDNDELKDEVQDQVMVFKRNDVEILGVVSEDYKDISTRHIHTSIKESLQDLNVDIVDTETTQGLVTRVWYELDGVGSRELVKPALFLKNSVFGASSLHVQKCYRVKANDGWLVHHDTNGYRKYHTGDNLLVYQELSSEVEDMVSTIWSDYHLVEASANAPMDKNDHIQLVLDYRNEDKITREMAGKLSSHIMVDTWSDHGDTEWNLIESIVGYSYHGNLSSQNRKRLTRMADEIIRSKLRQEISV